MIPKTIHYCWFGGTEKPKLAEKCIESWKKFCPDYEIIEWNESNFDVKINGYTRMCYENKKWAFLSDYVRLWVVYHYGGVYFDTDVELIKKLDRFLENDSFFGFETKRQKTESEFISAAIASGLGFGSVSNGIAVENMLKEYEPILDGQHGTIGCPRLNTLALAKMGVATNGELQRFSWGTVYPSNFFNPLDSATGKIQITENTVSIHWYMGSALTLKQRLRSTISKPFHRVFGKDCFRWIKRKIDR